MKVAINTCHGGFGLSDQAFELILERKGIPYDKVKSVYSTACAFDYYEKGTETLLNEYNFYYDREDADLIYAIESLGENADGWAAKLKIVTIPDDVEYEVEEYDGLEHIAEKHRTWQ
jgi:hypothetical protein